MGKDGKGLLRLDYPLHGCQGINKSTSLNTNMHIPSFLLFGHTPRSCWECKKISESTDEVMKSAPRENINHPATVSEKSERVPREK